MTKEYPLVSIIIPTYNRPHLLCEAIDSCLTQTYSNIEIIVVNDGGTKETENILKERYKNVVGIHTKYQVNDEKVIKYFYKENGGVSSARNYGLKKASGEYINFLDDDDLLLPEKIELQVSFFKKNEKNWGNLGVVYSGYLIMEKG